MKKIFFGLLLFLFLVTKVNSQSGYNWAYQIGETLYDGGKAIAVDASGNSYAIGFFTGTVDFDPGPGTYTLTNIGGSNGFVLKLNSSGNFVWVAQLSGTVSGSSGCTPNAIKLDASGNVYLTGTFGGTVDLDPGPGTFTLSSMGNLSDVFVLKLNSSGNFVWAKQVGSTLHDSGNSITVDGTGNIFVTGSFDGVIDVDPGPGTFSFTPAGGLLDNDIFVLKLDASGNFVWAEQMGGIKENIPKSISVGASGNVYVMGRFAGIMDMDPSSATYTFDAVYGNDIFIAKLDPSGSFVWAKHIDGVDDVVMHDYGNPMSLDATENIYVTGFYSTNVDFAGSFTITPSANGINAFVCKFNSAGNFLWAKATQGYGDAFGTSVFAHSSGDVYLLGDFGGGSGLVDFDPGIDTAYGGDGGIFVLRLNTSGNFMGVKQVAAITVSYPSGDGIAVSNSGDIITIGTFDYTDDFDPGPGIYNLTSAGYTDVFIQKMSQPVGTENIQTKRIELQIYPNPSYSRLFIFSGQTDIEKSEIEIINYLGQIVLKASYNNEINISTLAQGTYFLKIKFADYSCSYSKFVKE